MKVFALLKINSWGTNDTAIYLRTEWECTHSASITSRDICVLDSGMIYQHVSKSYEMRQEQVESVWDETNVPFSFLLSRAVSMRVWTRYNTVGLEMSKRVSNLLVTTWLHFAHQKCFLILEELEIFNIGVPIFWSTQNFQYSFQGCGLFQFFFGGGGVVTSFNL